MNKLISCLQIIGLLAGIWGLGGCSEEVNPTPLTYTQLLAGTSSKSWRLTGVQLIEANQPPVDIDPRELLLPCELDDIYVFYNDKDRKYEIQEGASKCSPTDPDVFFTDTWSVVNATASVNFILPLFATGTFTLKSLTERTMTTEFYFESDNFSYRFIFTSLRN